MGREADGWCVGGSGSRRMASVLRWFCWALWLSRYMDTLTVACVFAIAHRRAAGAAAKDCLVSV